MARREDRLQSLAKEIELMGGTVVCIAGDVTDAAARAKCLESAQSKFGGLDILVNNAGVGAIGPFETADPQRVRRLMEVNFFALVEMTRSALPHVATRPAAHYRQRQFDPRPPRRAAQQRVRRQQIRRARLQRVDPGRIRLGRHRRAGSQSRHDRHRVLRPGASRAKAARNGRSTRPSPPRWSPGPRCGRSAAAVTRSRRTSGARCWCC